MESDCPEDETTTEGDLEEFRQGVDWSFDRRKSCRNEVSEPLPFVVLCRELLINKVKPPRMIHIFDLI